MCDVLAERLKSDVAQWQKELTNASANWKCDPNTDVGKCLQKLSSTTTDDQINAIASIDSKQTQRLYDLREALKANPLQKAKETRAAIARLESFINNIANSTVHLAVDKTEQIKKGIEDAKITERAVKAFAAGQFDSSFLPGTGSDLWRTLWDSAYEYSTHGAYPNVTFPAVTDGSSCVLCQQELDDDAVKRLSRFDEFCKNTSQQLSANAENLLQTLASSLNLLLPLLPELDKVDTDLVSLSQEQGLRLSEFVAKTDERLQTLKQSIAKRSWGTITDSYDSPESMLKEVVTNLEVRAKTEESAHDPETRKKLSQELKELEAREWLSGVKANVLKQVEMYKIIAELEGCKKDLNTAPVTAKGTELTKHFVTDAFQKCFAEELLRLGLRTLQVTLEPIEGKKGETKFGLRLVAANNSKVAEIASEGEQRCIALAAFFAELSQSSHQSALVFDDPVSSLDHWHRERIANRLVDEVKKRQVIVFTHDVVFLNDLLAFAEDASIALNVLTLEWIDGAPGRYIEGLPWDSKKPLDCLTELEKSQKAIAAKWNPQPNEVNIEAMRHTYSRLRSTLERVVEVELLDGIVCRFESQVKAGRVRKLIGVTQSECDELNRLLNKCHQITDAHAPSKKTMPDPVELTLDISDARKLILDIRLRKKQIQISAGTT